MSKILLSALLGLLLTACASQSQLTKIDESQWTEVKCSGFLTWHDCRQEALAVCPNGFHMADQFENITIQRREVSIACKS